ncbi:MAG: UDP-N-acetyl glucosamine 2-epimerase, partial [Bacteroidales bacterium]|nr:UDP-N-acetyl glucosamine 2-epimerase [Bacteroidales bacterium]
PEEINRLVTDRLADLLLTPDTLSSENLRKEGVPEEKIKFVGNIMIDTLEAQREKASQLIIEDIITQNTLTPDTLSLVTSHYSLITLHRPSNVDNPHIIKAIIEFLTKEVTKDMTVIWPIHPRTEKQLANFGLLSQVMDCKKLILLHPLGYHDMLRLNMDAAIMLTDSGGLQEECTVLGTPCLTLRWNTERPVTLREHGGASVLVGNNIERIREEYRYTLTRQRKPLRPELWDGNTAPRCVEAILTSGTT